MKMYFRKSLGLLKPNTAKAWNKLDLCLKRTAKNADIACWTIQIEERMPFWPCIIYRSKILNFGEKIRTAMKVILLHYYWKSPQPFPADSKIRDKGNP